MICWKINLSNYDKYVNYKEFHINLPNDVFFKINLSKKKIIIIEFENINAFFTLNKNGRGA